MSEPEWDIDEMDRIYSDKGETVNEEALRKARERRKRGRAA